MTLFLLISAIILIACVIGSKLSTRFGVPTLLFFIGLGMLFGSDGLFQIHFEDYSLAEKICSAALIFIMFYGGFGTKWKTARPIAKQAVLLSTFGVFITAALTGIFCHLVLGLPPLEGLLIGAVLSSTDAASVFSILRSQKLNLKYSTAPMLEIESGSNDPCAYMLTIILLTSIGSSLNFFDISYLIFAQFAYGIIIGVILAFIILGNQNIPKKKNLVNFFDAFNGMMQMLIFFLLGLLVFPSKLTYYFVPALFIAIFLTFIARPITMAILLSPFKAPLNQQLIMSWAGLRGAASIVFAIVAVVSPNYADDAIFSIVFCVVLLSLLFQGALLPSASKHLNMIDEHENVLKTFNDYTDENNIHFTCLELNNSHPWINKQIRDIGSIPGTLIAAILRKGATITPKGDTFLRDGDTLIICAKTYQGNDNITLNEINIDSNNEFIGKKLRDIDIKKDSLVVLIQRNGVDIIPDGDTILEEKDTLVVFSQKNLFHLA